ncbi:MAG TPA: phosphotransferase [Solirubrobacteraceae bacterium]
MSDPEIVLRGGSTNDGLVVRVGDTVRRPERATSPATRALLEHLERVGFDGAPRHLGRDAEGREVLTYVEGEVPIEPHPGWALTDGALVSVAELLRRYHDAVASFDASGLAWEQPVPAAFRGGLICHNDPNLDNVVFSDGRAVALIDFDLAGPGSAVWDLACAARHWAPLRDERDMPAGLRGRCLDRLRLFADAYGLAHAERVRLPAAARASHEWAYDVVRDALRVGHPSFAARWRAGGRARAERTARWLDADQRALARALGVPPQDM